MESREVRLIAFSTRLVMRPKDILTKNFLLKNYVVLNKSYKTIAEDVGCSSSAVEYHVKKCGIKPRPKRNPKAYCIKDQVFGRLTVLRQEKSTKDHKSRWLCRCKCGTEKIIPGHDLRAGATVSCGCYNREKSWLGHENLSGSYWSRLKKSAKIRGHSFDICIEDAWKIFVQQNKRCALTGVKIYLQRSYYNYRRKIVIQTASLDRIDSKKGYTKDNIQWVHKDINCMKQQLDQTEFITWCRRVYEHHSTIG